MVASRSAAQGLEVLGRQARRGGYPALQARKRAVLAAVKLAMAQPMTRAGAVVHEEVVDFAETAWAVADSVQYARSSL